LASHSTVRSVNSSTLPGVRVRAQTTVSRIHGAQENAGPQWEPFAAAAAHLLWAACCGSARWCAGGRDAAVACGQSGLRDFRVRSPDDHRALRAPAIPEDRPVTDRRSGYAALEPHLDRAEYDLGASIRDRTPRFERMV
jgi:hypothetical protein